jgi:CPA2 family monovalent cation:H+ antiporter-2
VADENRETVADLRERGVHAIVGDATEPAVLIQAHVARAQALVLAIPDVIAARRMVGIARALNPSIHVVLRTHSDDEAALAEKENLGTVFMGERELGAAMARSVLDRLPAAVPQPTA